MYFSAAQYPALRGKSRTEQYRILRAASANHKLDSIRFVLALICALGIGFGVEYIAFRSSFPEWTNWFGASITGLIFYAYLLWDINGPGLRSVQAYMSENPDA